MTTPELVERLPEFDNKKLPLGRYLGAFDCWFVVTWTPYA